MDLLNLLMKSLITDDSVSSLTKKTGGSKSQITKLLILALPLIIKALTKNASSQSGASSLLGALTQHTSTNTLANQVANANQQDGSAILGHIFGNNMSSVTNGLAQQTGLTSSQVNTGLSSLAPAVLSGLSAATNATQSSGGVDLTSLLNTFAGQQQQQSTTGSLLGSLLGGSQPQQQSGGLLSSLFGGGQQQQQQSALNPISLLGSMMGGNTSSTNTTSSLLGSLLGRSTGDSALEGLSNILDDDDDDEDNFNGTALLNTLMKLKG